MQEVTTTVRTNNHFSPMMPSVGFCSVLHTLWKIIQTVQTNLITGFVHRLHLC